MSKEVTRTKVLIVGFGREGKSVVSHLKNLPEEYDISVADENVNTDAGGLPIFTGEDYLQHIDLFDIIIRSPGIPKTTPEFSSARHITTATNIFFENCKGTVIGVTGTKGKSTTSSLIYHILKTSGFDTRLVGNIGNPALDSLEDDSEKALYVAELSSYQLDDIRYSPKIAVVLPISQEHLSYHGSLEAYVEAKSNIAKFQTDQDFIVFFGSNEFSRQIGLASSAKSIEYPTKKGNFAVWYEDDYVWMRTNGLNKKIISIKNIPLKGKANLENVIAAITVANILRIPAEKIAVSVESFKPLEHRLELVGAYRGISFYNDSLATTPEATMHAMEALENTVTILIAGGYDRGLDFFELAKRILKSNIKKLILFPVTGYKIKELVSRLDTENKIKIFIVDSMQEAVQKAYQDAELGDVCLLSPASASFNMFVDYADRGNQFKEYIKRQSH